MAVKPWVGSVKPPTELPPIDKSPPELVLEREFVHGYRGKDCRNNVRYLNPNQIIYHAAGLAIIYDKKNNSQKFFDLHSDDITAFALSTDLSLCATGELGKQPVIYVWNTKSLES